MTEPSRVSDDFALSEEKEIESSKMPSMGFPNRRRRGSKIDFI